MNTLPLRIIGEIVSHLDALVDRLFVSLLCKRLFEHRLNRQASIDLRSYINRDDQSFSLNAFKVVLNMSNLRSVSFRFKGAANEHPFSESHPMFVDICSVLREVAKRSVRMTLILEDYPVSGLHHIPVTHMYMMTDRLTPSDESLRQHQYLPTTLKSLKMPSNFKGTLDNIVMPDGLLTLELPNSGWNHPILPNTLPSHLEELVLPRHFDQVIQAQTFPATLKRLKIGQCFTHSLIGVLPPSLTCLDMSAIDINYHHDLVYLPTRLTTIHLPMHFKRTLDHPPLQYIYACNYYLSPSRPFPNLKKLKTRYMKSTHNFDTVHFPKLTGLTIVDGDDPLNLSTVPWSTMKHCNLFCDYGIGRNPLRTIKDAIPFGVKKLSLANCNFSIAPPGCLPASITRLALWRMIGLKPGDIPSSVTWLEIQEECLDIYVNTHWNL
ncbi:hypothetical protein SAMD00019534_049130 [Acytostelium subglobosum LB1]|uniref:hypothetical protein n=1 Tax=Acytostelium subglobosum LB1 TaxID=1410327 RepID=UPI0006448839|nr:hypothetical protein SAMD00019534_049130 [Acytostelium subglobosum LB1]GAM21738.1 hypothetical protein SAMD00019534_049130 [Acytostelium subglobosum LB1]|eukprot:XP_012754838.1 hypothetical protein SAMD00019534_049130 [Acytostelium subglobosum LB1]